MILNYKWVITKSTCDPTPHTFYFIEVIWFTLDLKGFGTIFGELLYYIPNKPLCLPSKMLSSSQNQFLIFGVSILHIITIIYFICPIFTSIEYATKGKISHFHLFMLSGKIVFSFGLLRLLIYLRNFSINISSSMHLYLFTVLVKSSFPLDYFDS